VVILKYRHHLKVDAPINVSRLCPYKPPTILGQHLTPQAPVTVEGEEEYIVEEILDSRLRRNKLEFLVKWEGVYEMKIIHGNQRTIVGMRAMPLPLSIENILRRQDELRGCI